ncbi:MAG: L-aspartate oxidase [Bacteroidales bacterium]|jgi:L-aspartate oxidase|nr:L-aspartate oxidase [Bacteroidales bacterium]
MNFEIDFLVLGSGVAGLSFALKVADYGKVCILTKADAAESSTKYAQGGIAAVMYSPDSYEKHIKDTLIAGAGICDEKAVRITITEGPKRIEELILWGTNFDRKSSGVFDLAKEGGHSEYRILHHQDNTGFEIERALLERAKNHPNITIKEHQYAVDLITQHHLGENVTRHRGDIECYGAYVLNEKDNSIDTYLARFTLIATGGNGNVYSTTTNPIVATGDGQAMVHRAKGKLANMEFVQFHPTSLYNPTEKPSFLISEAMRGAGGVLKTIDGKTFMEKYDERKSLAPRDIVARAIDHEMKINGEDHVYLDCRTIDKSEIMNHFPNIYAKCLEIGVNITKDMIPVVPAAHYSCGGILVDENGKTTINNLYASGECSSTGLHGANRLASNSLLEALVYSNRAAVDCLKKKDSVKINKNIPPWNAEGMVLNEEMVLISQSVKELQQIMSNYVGIVRSELRLNRAFDRLNLIYKETEELYNRSVLIPQLCELRNLIANSYLIIKMAKQRKESVGLHYLAKY